VPKRGSAADKLLQLSMDQVLEREFVAASLPVYATWATFGGDATKTFGEQTSKNMERLFKLSFPYTEIQDSAQRQAQERAMVDRVFEAMGYTKDGGPVTPPPPPPPTPKRPGIWDRMKNSFKRGEPT
jgi:hypothetical protein